MCIYKKISNAPKVRRPSCEHGWTLPRYIILNLYLLWYLFILLSARICFLELFICKFVSFICMCLSFVAKLSEHFWGNRWTSCLPCMSIFAEMGKVNFSAFWWPFWKSQPNWKFRKFRKHPSCRNLFLCQIWLRTLRQYSG